MGEANRICLNGFRVLVESEEIAAYQIDMPDNGDLKQLRDAAGSAWALWWDRGRVLAMPTAPQPPALPGATPVTLALRENLGFVAFLINNALPKTVPYYTALHGRRFTFLGKKGEFVAAIREAMKGTPRILEGFAIRPRYTLDARTVEPADQAFIGLFATLETNYEIDAGLGDLQSAGISLTGLDVVRRTPGLGERRLVGRIERLEGDEVVFSESFDGVTRVKVDEVALAASKEAFTHCLKTILGARYDRFEHERQALEGNLLGGPGIDAMLTDMGRFLASLSPFEVASGLRCVIGERIAIESTARYRSVHTADPVTYCFDPARTKRHQYAWPGLEKYGPFSRDSFATRSPRILVIVPDVVKGYAETFIKALRDGDPATAYPAGFAATFRLANPTFILQPVDGAASRPHAAYRQAIETALDTEQPPDVAIVVLRDEQADLPDAINPYLHAKALLLMAGVPSQEVRTSTIRTRGSALAYRLQNIAIALYAKLPGGIPWTVDQPRPIADEIVIGLGVAELAAGKYTERQRYMGVTTVFRGDGNYLLGSLSRDCSYDEYPHVLRDSVQQVLTEIKQRNGWLPGDTVRIVCHGSWPMRNRDLDRLIAECIASVGAEQTVEFAFLTVGEHQAISMLDLGQPGKEAKKGRKGVYAPERGTIVQITRSQRLLAVTGLSLILRPGQPAPRQLHLRLHPASTFRDLDYLTEQVLKFTSLSWRSTRPASKPVTIFYSEKMAQLLVRLRAVPGWSPALLNTRLRHSRWFL